MNNEIEIQDFFNQGYHQDDQGHGQSQSQSSLAKMCWTEEVHRIKAYNEMVAVAGPEKLEVFHILTTEGFTEFQTLARFSLGSSTTSMSFSRSSFSPSLHPETNQWHFKIELVVSTSDNTIRILSSTGSEEMMTLGSTESKCNDVSWSEAEGYENFIAAAGDDRCLYIWKLLSPQADFEEGLLPSEMTVISFSSPLTSVSFHPSMASLLLVSDSTGVTQLIDFHESIELGTISSLITLSDPSAKAANLTKAKSTKSLTAWKRQDANLFAKFEDGSWKVWDLRRLNGGEPCSTGRIYEKNTMGGLRWSPTDPRLIAIFVQSSFSNSSQSLSTSLSFSHPISILDSSFPTAPRQISRTSLLDLGANSSHSEVKGGNVKDVDWLDTSSSSDPLLRNEDILVVAVGKKVILVSASSARVSE